jgi:hypothetical protein
MSLRRISCHWLFQNMLLRGSSLFPSATPPEDIQTVSFSSKRPNRDLDQTTSDITLIVRVLISAICQNPELKPMKSPIASEGRYQRSCIKLKLPQNEAALVEYFRICGLVPYVAHYMLDTGVVLKTIHREVLTVTGVTETTMWHFCSKWNVSINPHTTKVQSL